jgi:hypothetical protein
MFFLVNELKSKRVNELKVNNLVYLFTFTGISLNV